MLLRTTFDLVNHYAATTERAECDSVDLLLVDLTTMALNNPKVKWPCKAEMLHLVQYGVVSTLPTAPQTHVWNLLSFNNESQITWYKRYNPES